MAIDRAFWILIWMRVHCIVLCIIIASYVVPRASLGTRLHVFIQNSTTARQQV